MSGLPKYTCWRNKIVEAGKIKDMVKELNGFRLTFQDSDATVLVSELYMNNARPYPGGYYVLYPDEKEIFFPAVLFEKLYKPAITE